MKELLLTERSSSSLLRLVFTSVIGFILPPYKILVSV